MKATGRCIFAMRITEKVTFNEYWANPRFSAKKPVRNGSQKMMVGDNIYHRDANSNLWHQADSHHSLENGSVNQRNLRTDTISDKVLISEHFFYFGSEAPVVPQDLLNALEYKNSRGHRTFIDNPAADRLVKWLEISYRKQLNEVIGDPFDFDDSEKRYRGA